MKIQSLFLFATVVLLVGWTGAVIWQLEQELEAVEEENHRLHLLLDSQVTCPETRITCECPDYDQGWEDSEFTHGCDPTAISLDELENICFEYREYGYVAGC